VSVVVVSTSGLYRYDCSRSKKTSIEPLLSGSSNDLFFSSCACRELSTCPSGKGRLGR
jgi:hypothetical protein